jgi:MFS family permease
MSTVMPVSAGALLTQRSFLFFLLSRSLSRFSSQIAAVAIGWQIYDLTGSAFVLGMVGLVQFLPTALLVFVAGQAADRYERKRVLQVCQFAEAMTALCLAWGAYTGTLTVAEIFVATFVLGTAGAFESPATAALLPLIAPPGSLQRATALSSGSAQIATITGPALGGLAYAVSPGLPYGIMLAFWLGGMVFAGAIELLQPAETKDPAAPNDVFAGVRFIRGNPAILGTISLDLFAVLFGGATVLLPIYAAEILHAGARGLGWLRAAPSIGAISMAFLTAHLPSVRRPGRALLWAVAGYGAATVVFGVSRSLWLSFAMLVLVGACDNMSVVLRNSVVQTRTPDELRGRVSSVHGMFISSSNQLGAVESGWTAAWFGTVTSVVAGGLATLAIVAGFAARSSALRKWRQW